MTVAVIVQARFGSKRFPGKVFADLCGRPVLWHVLTRAREIQADAYALAVTPAGYNGFDDLAKELGWQIFLSTDEADVLGRYYGTALHLKAGVIVRVTGDCPLLDPVECNRVLNEFKRLDAEYYSNTFPRTVPSGYDCEVFTFDLLERANKNTFYHADREHVTPWMQRNAKPITFPEKYSIDTPEDLERVRAIMGCRNAA